ncbi:MAG: hypothetical protein ACR2G5_00680 [Pyrinomonadaceae bacterium]
MKKRLLIVAIICFAITIMVFPIETTVVPEWKLQVVDVNGTACSNMRVTQSWGHYSLYTGGNPDDSNSSDDRPTDTSGYVLFPKRTIRASIPRRLTMPIITRIFTIMHGGGGVDGAVWASGIKDVAWLSYKGGKSLPDKMRVEKCLNNGTEQSLAADGATACFSSDLFKLGRMLIARRS